MEDKKGKTVATLFGKWDESLYYIIGGNPGKGKGSNNESSKPHLLWKRSPAPEHQTRYNLTQFAITLNELTPGLKVSIYSISFFFFFNPTFLLCLMVTFHKISACLVSVLVIQNNVEILINVILTKCSHAQFHVKKLILSG